MCCEHAEQAGGGGGGGGATGLLNKGGGSNRLPGLVTKQQAVEFPQLYYARHELNLLAYITSTSWQRRNAGIIRSNLWQNGYSN